MSTHDQGKLEANFQDKVMLVEIDRYIGQQFIYDAARYAWKASLSRAKKLDYVLESEKELSSARSCPRNGFSPRRPISPVSPRQTPGASVFVGMKHHQKSRPDIATDLLRLKNAAIRVHSTITEAAEPTKFRTLRIFLPG
jgi:hypothetical protein